MTTHTISKILGRPASGDSSKRGELRADYGNCHDACATARASREATAQAHVDAQKAREHRQSVFDERGDEASLADLNEARRTEENAEQFAGRARRLEAKAKESLATAEHALLEDELEELNAELSDDSLKAVAAPFDSREAEVLEELVAVISERRGAAQAATHKGNWRLVLMTALGMDVSTGVVLSADGKTSTHVRPPSPSTGIISYRGAIRDAFLKNPSSRAIRKALVKGLFESA